MPGVSIDDATHINPTGQTTGFPAVALPGVSFAKGGQTAA